MDNLALARYTGKNVLYQISQDQYKKKHERAKSIRQEEIAVTVVRHAVIYSNQSLRL